MARIYSVLQQVRVEVVAQCVYSDSLPGYGSPGCLLHPTLERVGQHTMSCRTFSESLDTPSRSQNLLVLIPLVGFHRSENIGRAQGMSHLIDLSVLAAASNFLQRYPIIICPSDTNSPACLLPQDRRPKPPRTIVYIFDAAH